MYAFFEFKIKVRLWRSAWHGYQWCVRSFAFNFPWETVRLRRNEKQRLCKILGDVQVAIVAFGYLENAIAVSKFSDHN